MDEVLDACRNYFQETGRRITFEYSLVAGVNDSDEDARELSSRIHDINCHVNLIPVNPIKERSYRRSTHQAVENFKIKLEKCGINVTIRREMGSDIDGACAVSYTHLEILMTSGEQTGEEGCLSVPGMSGQVTRPNYVKVKALDMDMNEQIYEGEGLLARAFCHELDHLDGKMYTRLVEGELHHVSYDNEEEEE